MIKKWYDDDEVIPGELVVFRSFEDTWARVDLRNDLAIVINKSQHKHKVPPGCPAIVITRVVSPAKEWLSTAYVLTPDLIGWIPVGAELYNVFECIK